MSARLGLAAAAIALAAAMPSTASAATNLGAFWHLDESSASTTADSSGNNNHGIVNGATPSDGRFDRALNFDSAGDDSVAFARSPTLEGQAMTVEAWVNESDTSGPFRHIVSMGAQGCDFASYALFTGSSGGVAFHVSDGTQSVSSPQAPASIWDGAWHHVAGTYDGTSVRLYVDGVEIGNGTPTTIQIAYGYPAPNGLLGAFGADACPLNWIGDLDEPRIWRRAFSAQEVAASAAMGAPATQKLSQLVDANQAITYTSQFAGNTVVVSTESSTGTEKIDTVKLVGLLPLTSKATCSGGLLAILNSTCTITKSNGDRTARVTLSPLSGKPTVTLRVNLKSGRTFNVTVATV